MAAFGLVLRSQSLGPSAYPARSLITPHPPTPNHLLLYMITTFAIFSTGHVFQRLRAHMLCIPPRAMRAPSTTVPVPSAPSVVVLVLIVPPEMPSEYSKVTVSFGAPRRDIVNPVLPDAAGVIDANRNEETAATLLASPSRAMPPKTGEACNKSGTPATSANGAGEVLERPALFHVAAGSDGCTCATKVADRNHT